jgi:hypothetical protein
LFLNFTQPSGGLCPLSKLAIQDLVAMNNKGKKRDKLYLQFLGPFIPQLMRAACLYLLRKRKQILAKSAHFIESKQPG